MHHSYRLDVILALYSPYFFKHLIWRGGGGGEKTCIFCHPNHIIDLLCMDCIGCRVFMKRAPEWWNIICERHGMEFNLSLCTWFLSLHLWIWNNVWYRPCYFKRNVIFVVPCCITLWTEVNWAKRLLQWHLFTWVMLCVLGTDNGLLAEKLHNVLYWVTEIILGSLWLIINRELISFKVLGWFQCMLTCCCDGQIQQSFLQFWYANNTILVYVVAQAWIRGLETAMGILWQENVWSFI